MQKILIKLTYLLFVLQALLPIGTLAAACFGYSFELVSYSPFAMLIAISAVLAFILSFFVKPKRSLIFSLLLPCSLINTLIYTFKCSSKPSTICMIICAICCLFLTLKFTAPIVSKILSVTLSALIAVPTGIAIFVTLVFGNIVSTAVVQSADSPDGTKYAQIIDNDQGALGGNTIVNVYERKGFDARVFKVSKKPSKIYQGEWDEFKSMEMYWKDDNTLIINSTEYKIS